MVSSRWQNPTQHSRSLRFVQIYLFMVRSAKTASSSSSLCFCQTEWTSTRTLRLALKSFTFMTAQESSRVGPSCRYQMLNPCMVHEEGWWKQSIFLEQTKHDWAIICLLLTAAPTSPVDWLVDFFICFERSETNGVWSNYSSTPGLLDDNDDDSLSRLDFCFKAH